MTPEQLDRLGFSSPEEVRSIIPFPHKPTRQLKMKTSFLLALVAIGGSNAFNAVQRKAPRLQTLAKKSNEDGHDIVPQAATSAFRDIDIDMDRVKDCAEHFGKCSVKEIKQLRKGTHVMIIGMSVLYVPNDFF